MSRLLANINGPEDLRKLSTPELVALAVEIRDVLITTISKNGGHLAPNLGVVELTLALHSRLRSPRDKIVWDVGHQSYVHKLVTGRYPQFSSIRTFNGLSGFPKPLESAHDIIATGHTSTSISTALGLALARDLEGDNYSVCAVIGDGALTGGLALEALNHAGHVGTNLLVVLNDNEMSIAPNVGALASYLSRLRTDPAYWRVKEDVEFLLRKIPAIGGQVVKTVERLKDSLKYLLVAGILFEELGFTYLGPVDGHNLPLLQQVVQKAQKAEGPVLLHVITTKGKGYGPAEQDPDKFHGVGPFQIDTGKPLKDASKPSYTEVFGKTLVDLAKGNGRIVGITAAMPNGTGLDQLAETFPDRCYDVGIAEQHAVSLAAGLATGGYQPVVAVYSTFLQRAYDQIVHDICLPGLPVTFAIDRAGIVGEDGPTHHGVFDLSYLRHVPGMVVMAPQDERELQEMLTTAVNHGGPVAIRYPRGTGEGVELTEAPQGIPIGKAQVRKTGKDAAILAIGPMVSRSMAAADFLAQEGIDVAVINVRFVKPLDEGLVVALAKETENLVIVEEHGWQGGLGSAILELLSNRGIYNCRVRLMGVGDNFIEHGPRDLLLENIGLSVTAIIKNVKELLTTVTENHLIFTGEKGKKHA